ncbi:hypothetical protein FHT44_005177 [Mycolicibacterium sp. BK634]|uniref:hypothetical protein n=1 Tax=Mycolicibacterium sp. BK634 TaxID=2587099 RepID=UPI00161B754C|nr:hypothetical protein [Mycolicibacterium sp. BK634]MBB3752665.1 hypothetical protein [Mycolicibacterium sp. BK634]
MTLHFVSVDSGAGQLQARYGDYRYQIRPNTADLGPWFLDIYNDANSSPGNVDVERILHLPDRATAEAVANEHVLRVA